MVELELPVLVVIVSDSLLLKNDPIDSFSTVIKTTLNERIINMARNYYNGTSIRV